MRIKDEVSRYDLPGSRILIRSLRHLDRRLRVVLGEVSDPVRKMELESRVMLMVRDLVVVRLLEDRLVVRDFHLCGGKRTQAWDDGEARSRLREFNEWAGWEVFELGPWEDPGPGVELGELYRELHLSRFWPVGMPVEVLGALWEERLPTPRRSGVFYTPRRIVDLVLSNALGEAVERGRSPARVLDPACGAGYFLVEALRRLGGRELSRIQAAGELFAPVVKGESGQRILEPARRMEMVREHLFGVDIDREGLELARRMLFIETVADTPAFLRPAPAAAALFENFREGDSLVEESFPLQAGLFETSLPPALKPFRWRDPDEGFGRVMKEGGFTCIVGNPPWVSLKGRHRQAPYAAEIVEQLIGRYQADTYRPNMVEFFIRRAIELLADTGWHSFVVPDRIAENDQYEPLRAFMLERGELVRLHFREPFPGVAADTLIYTYQKKKRQRRSPRIVVTDVSGRELTSPQAHWLKGQVWIPAGEPRDDREEILKKIESAGRRKLSDFLETGVGFISRPNLITATREHEAQQAVLKGEHIAPYQRRGEAYFEFKVDNLAGGTRSLAKLAHPERVLIRKTGARLIAAVDRTGDLPEQSLYFAFLQDRRLSRLYDLRYFLGLLNSRTMSYYFRHRKITNRATTPQIKKVHLDTLPIRPINFNDQQVQTLHDRLVAAVQERELANDAEKKQSLNEAIEQCVAQLYGLEPKELDLIKSETGADWE